MTGSLDFWTLRDRDGHIDESADACGGLGCSERDGDLGRRCKVRERPIYDLGEAPSTHRSGRQYHAIAACGHGESRDDTADIMDNLDREPSSRCQPLQVVSETGAFRGIRDDESLLGQIRRLQGVFSRERMIGSERHAKGFAMNYMRRQPCRVTGPRPYQSRIQPAFDQRVELQPRL